jgi:hypothetical protein
MRWVFESGFTIGLGGSLGVVFYYTECQAICSTHTIYGTQALSADGRGSAFTARLSFDMGISF